jgi:hypothetical protein
MRSLISFAIIAATTLGLIACGEGEETKKSAKVRQGTVAECNKMWSELDHLDSVYNTLSKDHQQKICATFITRHEGLQCQRKITEILPNGDKVITTENMEVTQSYDCASGSRP